MRSHRPGGHPGNRFLPYLWSALVARRALRCRGWWSPAWQDQNVTAPSVCVAIVKSPKVSNPASQDSQCCISSTKKAIFVATYEYCVHAVGPNQDSSRFGRPSEARPHATDEKGLAGTGRLEGRFASVGVLRCFLAEGRSRRTRLDSRSQSQRWSEPRRVCGQLVSRPAQAARCCSSQAGRPVGDYRVWAPVAQRTACIVRDAA